MADVLVTIKIMPTSPSENLEAISDKASRFIKEFGGQVHRSEQKPVAFGLNSIEILFIMPEAKGSTEPLEDQIAKVDGVSSVDVIDVRRALG